MARSTAKLQKAMFTTIRSLSTVQRTLRQLVLFIALGTIPALSAQSFVNGNFEGGSTGWSGCTVEIGTAPTYGGTGTGHVAEVDGNTSTGLSDDRLLCQDISGFTIGSVYRISFDATRRGSNTPPDPVVVTMTMDDALDRTVTRSGGYAMVHGYFDFTATLTTHAFHVSPNFQGSYGMLFDNFSITLISALPVGLLYFDGEVHSSGVRLFWSTATELNNHHFTVQRSHDGSAFEDVMRSEAAGNSQERTDYSVIDAAPVAGLAFYRLKQTDTDGTETLFTVVPIEFHGPSGHPLTVFPNPSPGGMAWLCARGLEKAVTVPVLVFNAQGCLIYRAVVTMQPGIPLDLGALVRLRQGSYTVSVPIDGVSETLRLTVL